MRKLSSPLIAALLGLPLSFPVQAQQPTPRQKKSAKVKAVKARKVWTEEDLWQLRTPADIYADQKQAAQSPVYRNSLEKPAPVEQEERATRDPYLPPRSVQEAESRFFAKREEIRYQEESIQRTRDEYDNERDEAIRRDLKKTISRMAADLEAAQAELKLLDASVAELKSKPGAERAPQTTANRPPQNK